MNILDKDIKYIKRCYLMSQKAEAVPPLGTILGNIGVNTIKFCDEFNQFTK
jgi:ribosomal protein L11